MQPSPGIEAAAELLAFYGAPAHSPAWMAVYLGTRKGDGFTPASRASHAERIRAALDPLLTDSAFRSRPVKLAPHRPPDRTLQALRSLGLSREAASAVLAALVR
jgi:hypothetical protein